MVNKAKGCLQEDRVDIHQNARTTPASRAELVARVLDDQRPVSLVAAAAGVCPRTVRTWIARYQAEGPDGLADRSSRPHRQPRATPVRIVSRITALRLQRRPGIEIARTVGISPATVSRILRRAGLHRLDALEPDPPVRRYEREHPGELLHLDIKKLARFQQPGHRVTGNRRQCTPAPAGTTCTSASTTTPASVSLRSIPTRPATVSPPSSKPLSPTSDSLASTSAG